MEQVVLMGSCPIAKMGTGPDWQCGARHRLEARVEGEGRDRRLLVDAIWPGVRPSGDGYEPCLHQGALDVPTAQRWGVLPHCRVHRAQLQYVKLRAIVTPAACSHACEHGEGTACRCSCGGANHGIAVR